VTDSGAQSSAARGLFTRWVDLVGHDSATRDHGEALLRRWAEPHRHYHDLTHLAAVLANVDHLVLAEPGTATDADAVRLAAFFHDAVYDPMRPDNEAASATLAGEVLTEIGVPERRIRETVRLVVLTATHEVDADDGDGAVLCDADLAVLAGDPDAYAAYAVAVREEYGHVPDALFREGRARILVGLLEHDHLFRTSTGRSKWEAAARHNVETELLLLSAQLGGAGGADADRPPGAG